MDNEFTSVAAWLQATGPYGLVAVLGWAFWRVNEKKDRELKALHEKIVELAEAQTARGSKVFAPGRRRERGARSGSARERSALTHERTTDGRISCQLSGRGPGGSPPSRSCAGCAASSRRRAGTSRGTRAGSAAPPEAPRAGFPPRV